MSLRPTIVAEMNFLNCVNRVNEWSVMQILNSDLQSSAFHPLFLSIKIQNHCNKFFKSMMTHINLLAP